MPAELGSAQGSAVELPRTPTPLGVQVCPTLASGAAGAAQGGDTRDLCEASAPSPREGRWCKRCR